jgi:hypothetical protein
MQHLDDGALQAWLDGPRSGLSASEREEIQRHLSSCEACARRLAGLNESSLRVQTLLSGPESADATVPAFETVLARARQRQGLGRRRPRWAAAAWAASIAAAIGLGWLGSNLYRGGGVTRTAVEATKTDSAAPVVAAATPARDTSPTLQGAAGTPTQPAALTHPAAPVVVAAKPAEDTSPRGGTARASARLSTPVKTAARPATSVASAEKAAAEVSLPAQPVPAEVAERLVAHAADAVPSDSSPTFIRGRVTDESGRPLAAAQVVAEGTGAGAITGKDGTFELSLHRSPADSATRPVTLTAQLIGYRTESRKLDTHAGNVVSADFHLVPQDVALNEMVVSGVSARARENAPRQEIVVPLDQPAWGSWRSTSRAEAEAATGFGILTVPDLPVVRIEVGSAAGAAVVRVVQTLADGGSLELVESGSPVRFGGAAPSAGYARATVQRGDVYIAATAPVAADALNALLDRLR